jgi:predicted nucleotidyltransferase
MPPQDKPRHRSGYRREETEQVEATCLTVALTLGSLMDQMCIVGGLVPSLIIDRDTQPDDESDEAHAGTNDLDVGLAVALLDDQQYTEISRRLRAEGFEPDVNEDGNRTPQRWRLGELKVTVDFLMPALSPAENGGRIQHLEGDFAALTAPGLQLAFDERQEVLIEGYTLHGEKASRTVPVCGPASFTVLKALAFQNRSEPKDAYDLIYVLRRWPKGIPDIVERLAAHHERYPEVVQAALAALASDFAEVDSIGPMRAASFSGESGEDLGGPAADAHGFVDDILRSCRQHRLF